MNKLEIIKKEIDNELGKAEIQNALLATTFKGLDILNVKKAMFEGMVRGFTFKDFLEKNIYAIKYGQGYSLMTSIDYARKIGMRSGIIGKGEPIYKEDDKKNIISCSVTVKKATNGIVGDFTATVFFSEFNTGFNLWKTKPRVMIAKVAEMHALRMACPEELSQTYVEEEMQKEIDIVEKPLDEKVREAIDSIKSIDELKVYYLEHKGLGKAFDKYVSEKKVTLQKQIKTKDVETPSEVKGS